MFSHLDNLELSIVLLIVAIFVIKPIPLFIDRDTDEQKNIFQSSQATQLDWAILAVNR